MNGATQYRLLRLGLDVITALVPESLGRRRLGTIIDQDAKNVGFDLQGFEYRKLPMARGEGVHRFYHRQSERPGAPPLIFLHGLTLDGRSFFDYAPLARDFELIAYDFPEESDLYTGNIDDFTTLLLDFFEVRDIDRFHLAGVSFGGMVALRLAGTLGERLLSTAFISSRVPNYDPIAREQSRMTNEMVRDYSDTKLAWLFDIVRRGHLRGLEGAERDKVDSVVRLKHLAYYRQVAACAASYLGREDAERVQCPALLMLGTADRLMPLATLVDFRECLPSIRIVVVPDGGHDMTLKNPEVMLEHLQSFYSSL